MKKIDDIIRENKEAFNSEKPLDGHFERFTRKLQKNKSNKLKLYSIRVLKAASIAILIGLSSLWIHDNYIKNDQPDRLALGDLSPEYKEVETYYTNLVNVKYNQLIGIDLIDEKQKTILWNELKEMDTIYISLQEDLHFAPNDERVINAMINHYKLKIDILEQLIDQLKQIKTIKIEEYENTEI